MRQTHTFLLTIFVDEGESELQHGRIQYVDDESETFFRDKEELLEFVSQVIKRALPPSQEVRDAQSDE